MFATAIVLAIAVVALLVLARLRQWRSFAIAMTVAVVAISLNTILGGARSVETFDRLIDVVASHVYVLASAAVLAAVATWPVRAVLDRPSANGALRAIVMASSSLFWIGYLYVTLFVDVALWRDLGLCLFPGDQIEGTTPACSFDKRHKAVIPGVLLLLIGYALALLAIWTQRGRGTDTGSGAPGATIS